MAERPKNLDQHIRGIDFPVEKRDLVSRIRGKGAPDDVVRQIERLPDQRFQNEQELQRAFERM